MEDANIYNSIRTVDVNSNFDNDKEAKLILSNKSMLAIIMSGCVKEFNGMSQKEIIQCIDNDGIKVSLEPVNRNEIASTKDNTTYATDTCIVDGSSGPMIIGSNTEDSTVTEGTIRFDIKFDVTIPKALKKRNKEVDNNIGDNNTGDNNTGDDNTGDDNTGDDNTGDSTAVGNTSSTKDSNDKSKDSDSESIHMIINLEAQSRSSLDYYIETRALFYTGRLLSMQYGTVFEKMDYSKIRKVYSIWICTNPKKELRNTKYKIVHKYDDFYGICEDKLNKDAIDLADVIIINLGEHDKIDKTKDEKTNNLLHTLDVIFSNSTSLEQKLAVLEKNKIMDEDKKVLKQRIKNMSSISYGYFEKGYAEGKTKAKVAIIKSMLLHKFPISTIAENVRATLEYIKEIKKNLEDELHYEIELKDNLDEVLQERNKAEMAINIYKLGKNSPEDIKAITGFTYEEAVLFLEQTQNTSK